MASLFGEPGHAAMVGGREPELTPDEAAGVAEAVVISVPIDRTAELIRRLGPPVRGDALLMDVASVQEVPVEATLRSSAAPGQGDGWFDRSSRMLPARGRCSNGSDSAVYCFPKAVRA